MAKYDCELFGYFSYDAALSYNELHVFEAEFREALQGVLEQNNADFLQFEPEGDALRIQCVFNNFYEESLHAVCEAVCQVMTPHVRGKFLAVNKDLQDLLVYRLTNNGWSEGIISLMEV